MPKTKTNDTTRSILNFLLDQKAYPYRHNVLPIPLVGGGFRSGGKSGISDIIASVPCHVLPNRGGCNCHHSVYTAIEIKTGRDKLRDEQIGFLESIQRTGGIAMVVKDFEDFLEQWNKL